MERDWGPRPPPPGLGVNASCGPSDGRASSAPHASNIAVRRLSIAARRSVVARAAAAPSSAPFFLDVREEGDGVRGEEDVLVGDVFVGETVNVTEEYSNVVDFPAAVAVAAAVVVGGDAAVTAFFAPSIG